jgi:parvulin-like peptidyl-prolyl isomerase
MGWESEQENLPESVDWTKRVLYSIPVLLVLMSIVIAVRHDDKSHETRARVKHILISTENANAEQRAAAYEKVLDVRGQLEEGADFDKLAKKYSDDTTSRDEGGLLPWYTREQTVKSFDAYLWTGEIGKISQPIQTEFGYHLIWILKREISTTEQYERDLHDRLNENKKSGK